MGILLEVGHREADISACCYALFRDPERVRRKGWSPQPSHSQEPAREDRLIAITTSGTPRPSSQKPLQGLGGRGGGSMA